MYHPSTASQSEMCTQSLINHHQLINSLKQICCISTYSTFYDFGHLEDIPFLLLFRSTYFFPRKLWLDILLESLMVQPQGLYSIQSTAPINWFRSCTQFSTCIWNQRFVKFWGFTNIYDHLVKYALAYHILVFVIACFPSSSATLLQSSSLLYNFF